MIYELQQQPQTIVFAFSDFSVEYFILKATSQAPEAIQGRGGGNIFIKGKFFYIAK